MVVTAWQMFVMLQTQMIVMHLFELNSCVATYAKRRADFGDLAAVLEVEGCSLERCRHNEPPSAGPFPTEGLSSA